MRGSRVGPIKPVGFPAQDHIERLARYGEWMTVRELLAQLQRLPRDLEVLAFEAGCEDYCEREVDDYLAS